MLEVIVEWKLMRQSTVLHIIYGCLLTLVFESGVELATVISNCYHCSVEGTLSYEYHACVLDGFTTNRYSFLSLLVSARVHAFESRCLRYVIVVHYLKPWKLRW